MSVKLTVLVENVAGGKLLAEHGLSYLVETSSKKILFDTGHSDTFLKNANYLNINIEKAIDTVVLSHGHWDHGDGLAFLAGQELITHPDSFMKRYRKADHTYIGLKLGRGELNQRFNLRISSQPVFINNDIVYLGEIPRQNAFEAKTTSFIDESGNPDFVPDDSALAIINSNKLIIISGCAHAGICNTIEYAKKVTGITNIQVVIGGFHLKHNDKQTQMTIQYFQENNIEELYPSHCTEIHALSAFLNVFNFKQVKTGNVYTF
jgi:7,8-dihydropterin-6-yl-methyl-4-(beta-D-ribofuranosyl)aminobenzene 5'-phosphate synthase